MSPAFLSGRSHEPVAAERLATRGLCLVAVMLYVLLGCFRSVVRRMVQVSLRGMRMVRR